MLFVPTMDSRLTLCTNALFALFVQQMDSRLPLDTFETVLQLAKEGCLAIAKTMREALLLHTKRLAAARGTIDL